MTLRRKILVGMGAVAATLLLLLGLLFYTPPGLSLVARLVTPLSGGKVRITGIGGFFPDHITAARLEVADKQGMWLSADDISLDWSALSALFNHIDIDDVRAARIAVLRKPLPSASQGEGPVIDIAHLSAPRIALGAAIAGRDVTLSAQGRLHFVSLHDLSADLAATRPGSRDRYRINGAIVQDVARGRIAIREGPDGILGTLLGLPGLGPVNVAAEARGDAVKNVLSISASMGALQAAGQGTIQLAGGRADLDFRASAPAMSPNADISWRSLSAEGHFHGPFTQPRIDAHLDLAQAHFDGIAASRLVLDAQGAGGTVDMKGTAERVTIPGEQPDLFAHAPLLLSAHADLEAKSRPVTFALVHPLASLKGNATTAGEQAVTADVVIPSLAPFTVRHNMDLDGSGRLHLAARLAGTGLQVGLQGTLDAKGTAVAARLLGRSELSLTALLQGSDIMQSRLVFKGAGVSSDLAGTLKKGVLAYRAVVALSDLSQLAGSLKGKLSLHGTVNGPLGTAAVKAQGEAMMAAAGFVPHRIALALTAEGLPMPATARLTANGTLNDAPLHLLATLADKTLHRLDVTARWKSLDAEAHLALPDKTPPHGSLHLALAQMADIAPFTGAGLSGGVEAKAALTARGKSSDASFDLRLSDLAAGGAKLAALSAHGSADDLFRKPVLALAADAHGIAAAGFTGDGTIKANGPPGNLAADLSLALKDSGGNAARLSASAELDAPSSNLTFTALRGEWRGGTLTLDGPANIAYGKDLAIEHLAAHLGGGTITASGQIAPHLSFQARVDGVKLEDIPRLMPTIGPRGTLSADIDLSGTSSAPGGHIVLAAENLSAAAIGRGVAPATVKADLQLGGDHAIVDASIRAGTSADLALSGRAPLAMDGAMALHAKGRLDMALLDPVLAPGGRRARGILAIDADIAGTPANPRTSGGADLSGGELQDFARGIHVRDIAASIKAEGARLTIASLNGKSGPGTIQGSGSIDLAAPGLPVDMVFAASQARPIVSDLFTATMSGNLALKGKLEDLLDLSGKLDITRGEINLPENFPPEVAVLNVRRRGLPPPPPPSTNRIALDVTIATSGPIFVRGHGVDAVMGGDMRLSGTTAEPLGGGSFRMVRGEYSLGGQTLQFDSGTVTFDGTGVRRRMDPRLDFEAHTESGGVTATLSITGYASAPKIALSSSPSLPQDEIVARLLFQQSVKQLSPLQLASIAQALAAMGGVGGGFNPLTAVRRTLGLDRLAVGSATVAGSTQTQTTVEAGRYVANGVYVGVKQNLSGGTQTQVQVDITRRLKAQATLSTGATATTSTALQDNGSSVGLSYQFEY
ncbi:MAG: translocation/assembly module TamB domain-containing protein [Alphaproteobacteria bacterium]|nr:translocation/assembly module TamB domain-containing protein [Alphaproteobacteria bacterium]